MVTFPTSVESFEVRIRLSGADEREVLVSVALEHRLEPLHEARPGGQAPQRRVIEPGRPRRDLEEVGRITGAAAIQRTSACSPTTQALSPWYIEFMTSRNRSSVRSRIGPAHDPMGPEAHGRQAERATGRNSARERDLSRKLMAR